ncbi:hypothetical protein SAMN04487944_10245 [Gracilibacillus ureilyticus]|uniref:Uncharacterized protein n=1 Tax=Gracilibacillus ureilyticus TaxID=531814 RepID=A0A1H9MM16_9BACI|nr:hypothetical protein SAMN04487944_10245 [Gracilibacillus ureilyticus]
MIKSGLLIDPAGKAVRVEAPPELGSFYLDQILRKPKPQSVTGGFGFFCGC